MAGAQSFYDWEQQFKKHNNAIGISDAEFKEYMEAWRKRNLRDLDKGEKLIVVVDIETTGLSPIYDSIVEVGLCFLDLNSGEIYPIFNVICQEENKKFDKYSWVFQNSDLTLDEVIKAPYLDEFREGLQGIFDLGYPITAYNQEFDFGFLETRGFKIANKFWDPMIKLTLILRIPRYYGGYKWPSVQEAWRHFFGDDGYDEAHRALDDAMHEAKIIYETYKLLEKKQ